MEFDLLEFIGARAELLTAAFALGVGALGAVYAVVRKAVRDGIVDARRLVPQENPPGPPPKA